MTYKTSPEISKAPHCTEKCSCISLYSISFLLSPHVLLYILTQRSIKLDNVQCIKKARVKCNLKRTYYGLRVGICSVLQSCGCNLSAISFCCDVQRRVAVLKHQTVYRSNHCTLNQYGTATTTWLHNTQHHFKRSSIQSDSDLVRHMAS